MSKIYSIDIETTGLDGIEHGDEVLEIAVVEYEFETNRMSVIMNMPVYADLSGREDVWVLEHSTLQASDVALGVSPEAAGAILRSFLCGKYYTSYNTAFDFGKFLDHEPYNVKSCGGYMLDDPMEVAAKFLGAGQRIKLMSAYARLWPEDPMEMEGQQKHRALDDAKMACLVMIALCREGVYHVPDCPDTAAGLMDSLRKDPGKKYSDDSMRTALLALGCSEKDATVQGLVGEEKGTGCKEAGLDGQ